MSRGEDDDIGTMVMVIVGMMMASTLISQIPVDEDMNVWDKVKTVASSVIDSVQESFDEQDSGDAPSIFDGVEDTDNTAPPASDQPVEQPEPPAEQTIEAPVQEDDGSFAERLGFDFSRGD